jgi:hypothetical protein
VFETEGAAQAFVRALREAAAQARGSGRVL